LAPDGNHEAEFLYLLEVAKSWQTLMAVATITHAAVEFGLWQVILRKLEYPLIAAMFTPQQCSQIMQPILSAGLPAVGITCTFSRAIVHGLWQWGRLNIPNLFTEQIVTHIHTMMKYGGQVTDTTGSLLWAAYKNFRLESGLSSQIADFPECVYEYVTKTWVTQTCKSFRPAHIMLTGEPMELQAPREQDIELMHLVISTAYRMAELEMINQCQMYVKATFLSDICNAMGTHIKQHIWKHPMALDNVYTWPAMPKPTQMVHVADSTSTHIVLRPEPLIANTTRKVEILRQNSNRMAEPH